MDVIRSHAGTIRRAWPAAVIRPRPCACVRYIVKIKILWHSTITPQYLVCNYSLNMYLAHSCCKRNSYNDITGEIAKPAAAGRPKEPPPYKSQAARGTPLTSCHPITPHSPCHAIQTIRHLKTLSDTPAAVYTYLGKLSTSRAHCALLFYYAKKP